MNQEGLHVITNHVPRDIIDGFELTDQERKEFGYYSEEELLDGSFFRYKGWAYDLREFELTGDLFPPYWDGYISTSYFDGILVKLSDHNERVIVGHYYS